MESAVVIPVPEQTVINNDNNSGSYTNLHNDAESNLQSYDKGDITTHVHVKYSAAGLFNIKAASFLFLWYLFSGFTLFSNKLILETHHQDPNILGCSQILMTTCCGFFQLKCCHTSKSRPMSSSRKFILSMILLGLMRFATILLGLVALKNVTVSFTETVKSSAPVFTVIIAKFVIQESTKPLVVISLLPIMFGLLLTSAYDLSFNILGFTAALANNVTDCLQNVYSKLLISGSEYDFHPIELQFYTSVASLFLQFPVIYLLMDSSTITSGLSPYNILSLVLNGLFFHMQSYTAYSLMSYISPVTHSVANTVKRALLIWLSVLVFGNKVTLLSGVGMVLVSFGVFVYNYAKNRTDSVRS